MCQYVSLIRRLSPFLVLLASVLVVADPGYGESKRPDTAGVNAAPARDTPAGDSAAGNAQGTQNPGERPVSTEPESPGNSEFGQAQGKDQPREPRSDAPADPPATEPETPGRARDDVPAAVSTALSAVEAPALGASVAAAPSSGTVRVKVPGSDSFVALADAAALPLGTVFDATRGEIVVRTAVAGGVQDATFGGGQFELRQPKNGRGMTDVYLRGGDLSGCPRPHGKPVARAASRKRTPKGRTLWASDRNGRFRTHGSRSVATVRGTKWFTQDTCDGTLTKVVEGAVDVRSLQTGRVVRVKAGHSILVKRPA
jgi:hypothetical protein